MMVQHPSKGNTSDTVIDDIVVFRYLIVITYRVCVCVCVLVLVCVRARVCV